MTFFDFDIKEKDLASAKFIGDTRQGLIEALLEAKNHDSQISQAYICKMIDMDKGSLSKVLNGTANMTLRTLAEVSWALGLEPQVHFCQGSSSVPSNVRPKSFCGAHVARPVVAEVSAHWHPDRPERSRSRTRAVASRQAVRFENAS